MRFLTEKWAQIGIFEQDIRLDENIMGDFTNKLSRRGRLPSATQVGGKAVYKGDEITNDHVINNVVDRWLAEEAASKLTQFAAFESLLLKMVWTSTQTLNIKRTAAEISDQLIGYNMYGSGHGKTEIKGRFLSAITLTVHDTGQELVVACLGIYTSSQDPNQWFSDEFLDPLPADGAVLGFDHMSTWGFDFVYDPRDFPAHFLDGFGESIPITHRPMSHNADASLVAEIVAIGIPALAAGAFVKKFAEKAAEDLYEKLRDSLGAGLRALANHCLTLKRPEIDLATRHRGCEIHCVFKKAALEKVQLAMVQELERGVRMSMAGIDKLVDADRHPREVVLLYNARQEQWDIRHVQMWDDTLLAGDLIVSITKLMRQDISVGVEVSPLD